MLPKSTKDKKRLAGLPLSGLCHDSGLCRAGCCECPCSLDAAATWEMEIVPDESDHPGTRSRRINYRVPTFSVPLSYTKTMRLCEHSAKRTKGLRVSMIGGRAE